MITFAFVLLLIYTLFFGMPNIYFFYIDDVIHPLIIKRNYSLAHIFMLHSPGTQVGDDFLQPPPNLKEMLHIPKWLDIGQGTSHPCLPKRFHRRTFYVKTCYDFFLGSTTANSQETTSSGETHGHPKNINAWIGFIKALKAMVVTVPDTNLLSAHCKSKCIHPPIIPGGSDI